MQSGQECAWHTHTSTQSALNKWRQNENAVEIIQLTEEIYMALVFLFCSLFNGKQGGREESVGRNRSE